MLEAALRDFEEHCGRRPKDSDRLLARVQKMPAPPRVIEPMECVEVDKILTAQIANTS